MLYNVYIVARVRFIHDINHTIQCLFQQFLTCQGFPYSVFFIVGNEFCERFSYYGMRGEKNGIQVHLHTQTHTQMQTQHAHMHMFKF